MSSALDQSLDEILSSKPKRPVQKKKQVAKSKVGKAVIKPKTQKKTAASAPAAILDASYATKVVVYGLPRDIKQDAIKVC
jgi:THO complex subunit 4